MIRTIPVRYTDDAIKKGYTVILIVRSPGQLQKLIDDGRVEWEPRLAPSSALLFQVNNWKKQGMWNQETFDKKFVDEFIDESLEQPFADAMNDIFKRSEAGEKIALACYCGDECMCHRRIVKGLLQAVVKDPVGPNDSPYWLLRRIEQVKRYREGRL